MKSALPYAPDAERGILGAIIQRPVESLNQCQERFVDGPSVFYDLRHQTIYETMLQLSGANVPCDIVSLAQKLRDRKLLDEIGSIPYLNELDNFCHSPAHLTAWLDEVENKHTLRKIIELSLAMQTSAMVETDANGLLDRLEKQALAIRPMRKRATGIRQLTRQAIEKLQSLFESQGKISGLSTGLTDLDRLTDGLHGGEMIVVGGFPSTGKTALACGIAVHNALDGIPAAIFTAEMQPLQLVVRALCSNARLNKRRMAEDRLMVLVGSVGKFANAPLYLEPAAGLTISQIMAIGRRLKQKHGIKLLVVDYIQLIQGNGDNREQRIASISNGLKSLALELDCSVLALSQLTDDGKLRESRAIGQDADSVWKLTNQGDWQPLIQPIKLAVEKCRDGETGIVNLTFLKEFTRFESVSKVEDEQ